MDSTTQSAYILSDVIVLKQYRALVGDQKYGHNRLVVASKF